MKAWALVLLVVAASAVAAMKEDSFVLMDVAERLDIATEAMGRPHFNCDKGFIEVAGQKCCPKTHPAMIQGDCYGPCSEGSDDLTIGGYVGCRAHCEGGYSSSINSCHDGPHHHPREDKPRESKPAALQLPKPVGRARTRCRKGFVKVAYNRVGRGKYTGGCCPDDSPVLIHGLCYSKCPADQEDIVIGDFVGCRAHCPSGTTKENHNECTHEHAEETVTEREDFPRFGVEPERRRKAKSKSDVTADGCPDDWVQASESRCCPTNRPTLIGMLCYARCNYGYDESHFGCRRKCPPGYHSYPLTCTHKSNGKTFSRGGYERTPRHSKQRVSKDADSTQAAQQIAVATEGKAY
jgi:hypothetical protein